MGVGKDYAKKHSRFLSFKDDDGVISGVFKGMKPVLKESFGEEKEVMRYAIDEKVFDSQSGSLATQMDEIEVGTPVRITQTGSGMDTKYTVEKVANPLT